MKSPKMVLVKNPLNEIVDTFFMDATEFHNDFMLKTRLKEQGLFDSDRSIKRYKLDDKEERGMIEIIHQDRVYYTVYFI